MLNPKLLAIEDEDGRHLPHGSVALGDLSVALGDLSPEPSALPPHLMWVGRGQLGLVGGGHDTIVRPIMGHASPTFDRPPQKKLPPMKSKIIISLLAALALAGCTKKLEQENLALRAERDELRSKIVEMESLLAQSKAKVEETQKQSAALAIGNANLSADLETSASASKALAARIAELEGQVRRLQPPPIFELVGEAFIATRGGTNIKLGGIEVAVVDRADVEAWISERRDKKLHRLSVIEPVEIAAKKALDDAKAQEQAAEQKRQLAWDAWLKRPADAALSAARQSAEDEKNRAEKAADARRAEWRAVREQQSYLHSGAFYFETLPQPKLATRTNSEGQFRISVPQEGRWVVVAQARRAVGSGEELYYWAVPVSATHGSRIDLLLTNANLTSTEGGSIFNTIE